MHQQRWVIGAALLVSVGLAGKARAAEFGGQFGFGAGLAVGNTHREIGVDGRRYESGGGGAGLDFAARLWWGPLLVGGSTTVLPGLLGPTELLATGGAGLKLELGQRWRLMSLLEAGSHTVSGMGSDLFDEVVAGGTATLPCWGGRLAFVKQKAPGQVATLGVSLFFLADRRTEDVEVRVRGLLGSDSQQRHRAGGTLGGVALHATFGS